MRGNPGKRSLNKREAQVRREPPKCPDILTGPAREEWDRVVPQLYEAGLCAEVDQATLTLYCQAVGDWQTYREQMQKTGTLIKAPNGFVMQSPLVAMANEAGRTVAKLAREFGMTSSARSSIQAAPPTQKADDPWAALG